MRTNYYQQILPEIVTIKLDLTDIPTYHYNQVIPTKYRKNDLHDIVLAATLLTYHKYMTLWELKLVVSKIQQVDKIKIFDALNTCREIQNEN